MVTIITGTTKKPTSSELLKKFFHSHNELDGYLYIGYPIIGTVDGAYPIDGLWISPAKGLVIFNLIEGKNTEGYEEAQDDCANKIEAKLKGYRQSERQSHPSCDQRSFPAAHCPSSFPSET